METPPPRLLRDSGSEVHLEARALGDPTRYRLFRFMADSQRYLSVVELASYLQVHHNAVRQHLAVLMEANLVIMERERRSLPGRPRLLYRVNPSNSGLWGAGDPYRGVVLWLVDMIRSGRSGREVGREAGLKRAAEAPYEGMGLVDALNSDMAAGGYWPRMEEGRDGPELVLERCPFAEAASRDPGTICELHRGLLEGLVDAIAGESVSVTLLANDPDAAGCRVVLTPAVRRG